MARSDGGVKKQKNDNIKIKIRPIIESEECKITLNGYSPNEFYEEVNTDKIKKEKIKNENILFEKKILGPSGPSYTSI